MIATKPSPTAAAGPAGHSLLPALLSRPYPAVMGVLNVTPDSFSDGGQFAAPERALAQARRMIAEGADIIDIGAESTRPYGSEPISADEELQRLQPVLPEVVALGIPVSIDSMKSAVVAWALDQGAAIANDVWGLQRDPGMAGLVAERASRPSSSCTTATAPIPPSTSCRTSPISSRARSRSPPKPAFRPTKSCSIPASASARRPSRA